MAEIAPLPAGPFGCVLMDPPWHFRSYSGKSAVPTQAADPYATMTQKELKSIPLPDALAKDAAVFMWIVDSHLDQALVLGRSWGLRFKTVAFIWVKETKNGHQLDMFYGESHPKISMGHWSRKQAEICLLFTRGRPRRLAKNVRQIIRAPIREHSRKPDETHDRIEALVGGPYLEMFARQARTNWTAWGHETGKFGGGA